MTKNEYKNFLKWLRKKKKDDNDGGASGSAIHLTNNYKYGQKQRFHFSKTASVVKKKRHHQHFPQFDPRQHGPEIN